MATFSDTSARESASRVVGAAFFTLLAACSGELELEDEEIADGEPADSEVEETLRSAGQSPKIALYTSNEAIVTGSAYDPDCPDQPVEVYLYRAGSALPTICRTAGEVCPWPEICAGVPATSGFWCQHRAMMDVDELPTVAVAAIDACGGDAPTWVSGTTAIDSFVVHDRAKDVLYGERPTYSVGLSKKHGGILIEFFNKRADPTMNIIHNNIGSAFQSALFGADTVGDGGGKDCLNVFADGNSDGKNDRLIYNPTQAGSHCAVAGGGFPSVGIRYCFAGSGADCSGWSSLPPGEDRVTFGVRFRNFYYPLEGGEVGAGSYPYQPYDNVFGEVTYTFLNDYLQVDYQLWKGWEGSYGPSFQQLPIVFTNRLYRLSFREMLSGAGVSHWLPGTTDACSLAPGLCKLPVNDTSDGRWVSAFMLPSDRNAAPKLTGFTLGFYSKAHAGSCVSPRVLQLERFVPDETNEFTGAIQNNLTFEPTMPHYVEARTLVFPYDYDEQVASIGGTVGAQIDRPQAQGGLMPPWECNN